MTSHVPTGENAAAVTVTAVEVDNRKFIHVEGEIIGAPVVGVDEATIVPVPLEITVNTAPKGVVVAKAVGSFPNKYEAAYVGEDVQFAVAETRVVVAAGDCTAQTDVVPVLKV